MRKDWLAEDVFKVPLMKTAEERDRIYTPEEWALMYEAASPLWRLRMRLAKMCGLRKAEVLHLRYVDIDLQKMVLHVQVRKETLWEMFWEPKGKNVRTLPLPDKVAELVEYQRQELPSDQPSSVSLGLDVARGDLLAATHDGVVRGYQCLLRRGR